MILRSAAQMTAMIDDLVEYTGHRLGVASVISPTSFLLDIVVHEVMEEWAAIYPALQLDLQAAGDLEVTWDKAGIHRVLSNLLTNALKYGALGQPITIVLDGADDALVLLSVRNLGTPIPQDLLPRIFEPLATGAVHQDGNTQASGANLGLGLYIVREIVTAHRGSIQVISPPEAGTRFDIRMPRHAVRGS